MCCFLSRQETGQKAKKGEDRRSNRTRHNNKGVHRNMASNDSPEIPDRRDIRNALASLRARLNLDDMFRQKNQTKDSGTFEINSIPNDETAELALRTKWL